MDDPKPINRIHFSSASNEWETPPELFKLLDDEFKFNLDVCATRKNTKCHNYFSIKENGLVEMWGASNCWMNPPYGREIHHWVCKAEDEGLKTAIVVCLLPARTDTTWWHIFVSRASEIRFLRGRITFVGAKHPAPFPSAIVIFGTPQKQNPVSYWDWKRETR